MGRLQNFMSVLVISREQGQGRKVPKEIPEPDSANGDRNYDIGEGDGEGNGKIRLDDPEKIHISASASKQDWLRTQTSLRMSRLKGRESRMVNGTAK